MNTATSDAAPTVATGKPGMPPPATGQIASTAVIALVAGGLATSLFLHARNLSSDPLKIAAVDAAPAGEVLFLSAPLLGVAGWIGLLAVMAGFMMQSAEDGR